MDLLQFVCYLLLGHLAFAGIAQAQETEASEDLFDADYLNSFAGQYTAYNVRLGALDTITVYVEDLRLYTKVAHYNPSVFVPVEKDHFEEEEEWWTLTFERNEEGEIVGFEAALSDGRRSHATKVKQEP